MKERPNFYTILELDPSISDWPTIDKAIQTKRRTWSLQKNQGSPTARRKAEQYIRFIPDMETVFKDSTLRKEEAKAALAEQKKERKAQLSKLDELIKMLHNTSVTEGDIKLLVNKTGKVFTVKEVEARLKRHGIQHHQERAETAPKARPKLEASTAKRIRDALTVLKLNSLYEFVNLDHKPGLTSRSSAKALYDRADTIYKEISRTGKTDSESTTRQLLAGEGQAVFKSEQEKERYDNTLAGEVLLSLNDLLDIAGRDKYLEAREISSLLKEAKKLGVAEK